MLNKKVLTIFLVFLMIVPLATVSVAQNRKDMSGLLADIPEPPGAKTELPSPVPMVYQFMGALMDGNYDVCLSNFDVQTFLNLLFGNGVLGRLEKDEYNELLSYQIQSHRNEFRFLSKVMNRVAGGAKIDYSDPRYHGKVQSKITVRLDTNRGRFDFQVFCYYSRNRWYVYDYILNEQRLTKTFKEGLQGISVSSYLESLRPFYAPLRGTRPLRNKDYEFSMLVPNNYELHENISPSLLATLSTLNGQFLLHVQAANYETPQNLAQVGKAIKETLMPFEPRLFDQWKGEVAGVEVGNVLFHFQQGNRRLYCHMLLIPLGKKLVVMNFYHSTLQLMKHMSNIREQMIRTLTLPRIEAAGGIMPGEIPDELTINSSGNEFGDGNSFSSSSSDDSFDTSSSFEDNSFNDDSTFDDDNGFSSSDNEPSVDDSSDSDIPSSFDNDNSDDGDNLDWEESSDTSSDSWGDDESSGLDDLRPDSFVDDSSEDENTDDSSEDEEDVQMPSSPPPPDSYGDGNFGSDDDYGFDAEDDVEF